MAGRSIPGGWGEAGAETFRRSGQSLLTTTRCNGPVGSLHARFRLSLGHEVTDFGEKPVDFLGGHRPEAWVAVLAEGLGNVPPVLAAQVACGGGKDDVLLELRVLADRFGVAGEGVGEGRRPAFGEGLVALQGTQ